MAPRQRMRSRRGGQGQRDQQGDDLVQCDPTKNKGLGDLGYGCLVVEEKSTEGEEAFD